MAKKTWNPGTAPTGVGGDTPYSANNNHQSNADELYAHCGADAEGNLPDAQPVSKGGTGATTAAAARTNLGLGSASTKDVGGSIGDVMAVGAFGLGDTIPNIGITQAVLDTSVTQLSAWYETWCALHFKNADYNSLNKANWTQMLIGRNANKGVLVRSLYNDEVVQYALRGEHNTTVDGNGFVKIASPVVYIYSDEIVLNEDAQRQQIEFKKLGIGDYLLKNTSGFAQEGWYVEQPKDANGNVFHAVLYEALENGDLSIKTYNKILDSNGNTVADLNSPVDIKENRFISIRLNELPQDTTAPTNPTIVDSEGLPAPTKYHQLVDGMWVISAENQELLETELMAQMPKLTRRQFRLALVTNGYDLAEIETLIASIEDPLQRQIIQIEWQDSTVFERTSNSLNYMATLLELDRDQINALWQQALLL